jgi:hypothetical protein
MSGTTARRFVEGLAFVGDVEVAGPQPADVLRQNAFRSSPRRIALEAGFEERVFY